MAGCPGRRACQAIRREVMTPTGVDRQNGARAMSLFRIVDRDGEMVADADTLNGVTEVVCNAPPGRYHVDEISVDPLPSRRTARRWGSAIRHNDGRVILDLDPWEV